VALGTESNVGTRPVRKKRSEFHGLHSKEKKRLVSGLKKHLDQAFSFGRGDRI
jgi:hypothetical protein